MVQAGQWEPKRNSLNFFSVNGLADDFYSHLAIYIDKRLVQTYVKAKEYLDASPSQVIVTLDANGNLPYGLKYKYEENYISHLPTTVAPGTEK